MKGIFAVKTDKNGKIDINSEEHKRAMQERAVYEGRVARALELGGALRRGREEGRAEAFRQGYEEGRMKVRIKTARALIAEGLDKSLICDVLNVTQEELERMLA